MSRLADIARAVKSANAGASLMTFDIVFDDEERYLRVVDSETLTPKLFSRIYGVAPADVRIYRCRPVLTIKVTIPRRTASGGADETDFDGVQQFVPILDVEV